MYHKHVGTYLHIYKGVVRWVLTSLFSVDLGRERIGECLKGYREVGTILPGSQAELGRL